MAEKKEEWKRPEDVVTFRTSDPKEMLGNFLPKKVFKTWTEDFIDEDTKEVVSIERKQMVVDSGEITQHKLQEIMFAIQAGDIEDVEVCEDDVSEMTLYVPTCLYAFNVELHYGCDGKVHYVCYAQTISQAIKVASSFGQMYRGINGYVTAWRVVLVDAQIVPDDHACIPEEARTPAYDRKNYFKVTVRHEWYDGMKLKKSDTNYVIAANEVGEAKERIACLLDILKEEARKNGAKDDPNETRIIRKAVPFEVDCIVPREFCELYKVESSL